MAKKKCIAAGTLFVLTILVLWSYAVLKVVPLMGTYLGPDRIQYSLMTMGAALLGFLFFWLARRGKPASFLKYIYYILALVLLVGWPLLALWGNSGTFRGFNWSLDTLLIGLLPVLILALGLLIGSGKRIFALFASILFLAFAVLQLLALLRVVPRLGRAFSTARSSEVVVYVVIFLVSALFAWLNFRYFREEKGNS